MSHCEMMDLENGGSGHEGGDSRGVAWPGGYKKSATLWAALLVVLITNI